MDLIISPITAGGIRASMPLTVVFQDFLSRRSEICIEVHLDDHKSERFLFFKTEEGSKFSLSIKGKPGFCLAALHNLVNGADEHAAPGTQIDIFRKRVAEMDKWRLRTPIRDLFDATEEFQFEMTAHSHQRESVPILWSSESGAKLSVVIKGRPGFAELATSQIRASAPLLRKMIANVLSESGSSA